MALPVPDAQTLDSIVDVIFEKALDEPEYAPLYAKLYSEVHEQMAKKVRLTTLFLRCRMTATGGRGTG